MTCLGVLDRAERGDDNETGLEEGGVIEMSTTVLHSRCTLSSLEYLPLSLNGASPHSAFRSSGLLCKKPKKCESDKSPKAALEESPHLPFGNSSQFSVRCTYDLGRFAQKMGRTYKLKN